MQITFNHHSTTQVVFKQHMRISQEKNNI